MGIGRTFEPTRSGTGSFSRSRQAHASRQVLPLIRTLLKPLDHGSQARLRTFPHLVGDRRDGLVGFQMSQQEGRVQIALHRPQSAGTRMPPLGSGFLHIVLTVMAILRQSGLEGRDFAQGAASFCNQAFHMCYQHPWCAKYDTATSTLPFTQQGTHAGLFDEPASPRFSGYFTTRFAL